MIIKATHLQAIRETHKNESLVFAHGAYDLFHPGHLAYLTWSAQQGDRLIVGVSTDERLQQRKGSSRPIMDQQARLIIVDALKVVDYTLLTEGEYDHEIPASLTAAKLLKPDVVVLSSDCTIAERLVWQRELADTSLIIVHPEELRITSTSEIIERIRSS